MKTKLVVEIESKDTYPVLFEDGDNEKDYNADQKKDLPGFRKKYADALHRALVKVLIRLLSEDNVEVEFFDGEESALVYLEGWDDLKAYGIKIKVKKD